MKHAPLRHDKWLGAVYIASGICIIATSYFWAPKVIHRVRDVSHHAQTVALATAERDEIAYVSTHVNSIAEDGFIRRKIVEGDVLAVSSLMTEEAKRRNLYGVVAVDADGIVLSRSSLPKRRGDYIFDKTDWGLRVARGESVYGFEETVSGLLLILRASVPLMEDGRVIGAISVLELLNDAYASGIRQAYFAPHTEIAFYTKRGIIASSFGDESIRESLRASFFDGESINSVTGFDEEKEIKLGSSWYGLHKETLNGFDPDAAGILVFDKHQSDAEIIIIASMLTMCFLLLRVLLRIVFRRKRPHEDHNLVFIFFTTISFFAISSAALHFWLQADKIEIARLEAPLYNSTIFFSPDFDVVDRAFEQYISIVVSSGPETINAAQAEVFFDPAMITVTGIATAKSFCSDSMFLEKEIDNKKGRVSIACAIPNPGFSGDEGILAELVIEPLASGSFGLTFGDETKVLANDGLGTDVLRLKTDGYYRVLDRTDAFDALPLVVFSRSHTNSERWYQSRTIALSWRRDAGAIYRYALNQIPTFTPTNADPVALGNMLSLAAPSDGSYYFHFMRSKAGMPPEIIHKKIQIDSTPPPPPQILTSSSRVKVGEIVRLDFKNTDNPLTAQPGFYVRMEENDIFLPVKPPLYVPFAEEGTHTVYVKVFDKAGNWSQSTSDISVTEK